MNQQPPPKERPVTEPSTETQPRLGRGLVIAGSIVTGLYLIPAIALIVWIIGAFSMDGGAAGMVFPYWLFVFIAITPAWIGGIILLGAGRTQQRGPVKGAIPAWIIAIGAIPTIPIIFAIALTTDTTSEIAAYALVYGTPVLIALAFLAGGWLTLGKPRTPTANK
jgi:hypothetical protein